VVQVLVVEFLLVQVEQAAVVPIHQAALQVERDRQDKVTQAATATLRLEQ
jgi:hypothetical protein